MIMYKTNHAHLCYAGSGPAAEMCDINSPEFEIDVSTDDLSEESEWGCSREASDGHKRESG